MKNVFPGAAAAALIVLASFAAPAAALSCAPPVVNEETIQNAAVIFEGVVTAERKMVGGEQEDVVEKLEATATYTFQVTRAWKGVAKGSVVQVQRNTYWGDGFDMGQAYLVFGTQGKEGAPLTAGLCGPTVLLQQAGPYKEALAQYYEGRPKTETVMPVEPEAEQAE